MQEFSYHGCADVGMS